MLLQQYQSISRANLPAACADVMFASYWLDRPRGPHAIRGQPAALTLHAALWHNNVTNPP
jgi:hypothetical protein